MEELPLSHPLEFKIALLFSVLFIVFAAGTSIAVAHFGNKGLELLSFVTGLTDIDPFILSLLGGKLQFSETQLVAAVVIASGSNNLMKGIYAVALGRNRFTVMAAAWLALLFFASITYVWLVLR